MDFLLFLVFPSIHIHSLFLLLPPRDLGHGELACYMRQIHSAVERTDAPLLVLRFSASFLIPASAAGDSCLCCWTAQCIFPFFRGHCSHGGYRRRFDDGEKRHLMSMRRKGVDRVLSPSSFCCCYCYYCRFLSHMQTRTYVAVKSSREPRAQQRSRSPIVPSDVCCRTAANILRRYLA